MTAVPAESRRSSFAGWMAPVAVVAVLFAASVTVYLVANSQGASEGAPKLQNYSGAAPENPTAAFDVTGAASGKLSLSAGAKGANSSAVEVAASPGGPAEFLETARASDVRVGDDIVVVGVPNEVRSLAIRAIVLLPAAAGRSGPERAWTPGGFAGHEAERDQKERVVMRGKVTAATATRLEMASGGTTVSLDLTANAPLRKLRTGTVAEIRPGDRVALHTTDGKPDSGKAILVLVGGAQ